MTTGEDQGGELVSRRGFLLRTAATLTALAAAGVAVPAAGEAIYNRLTEPDKAAEKAKEAAEASEIDQTLN